MFSFIQKNLPKTKSRIPLKPAVGAIDLVTSTTEGIRNTTTLLEPKIVRTRPPRLVSHGHALLVN